jgi:hypothetical protein
MHHPVLFFFKFFCLDAKKNQKIKADAPLAENKLRYAKMPQTRYAQTVGIFDASLRSFSERQIR